MCLFGVGVLSYFFNVGKFLVFPLCISFVPSVGLPSLATPSIPKINRLLIVSVSRMVSISFLYTPLL